MTDKLKKIIAACKNSVTLEINPHRNRQQTVEQYIHALNAHDEGPEEPKEVIDKMVELGTVVVLTMYYATHIGFYQILSYDLDKAIEEGFKTIEEAEQIRTNVELELLRGPKEMVDRLLPEINWVSIEGQMRRAELSEDPIGELKKLRDKHLKRIKI